MFLFYHKCRKDRFRRSERNLEAREKGALVGAISAVRRAAVKDLTQLIVDRFASPEHARAHGANRARHGGRYLRVAQPLKFAQHKLATKNEKLAQRSDAAATQAFSESRAGHEAPREGRLIAVSFNDEQMRQARTLKHLVKVIRGERLQRLMVDQR
jgi:hypothetical protein